MKPAVVASTIALATLGTLGVLNERGEEAPAEQPIEQKKDEEVLKEKHGKYLQVTKDGRVLDGEREVREDAYTAKLAPNTVVNTYSGPQGDGYQVVTEYEDRIEAVGFGPQAQDFTYTKFKPIPGVATST